ncbi:MAG: DUF368 domain-containing protein [Bacteroidales bacterium]|nr:DUF368 domain-containing protein [Bacteroidales bacterium]
MKEFWKYMLVVLKGIGMGAANAVPGVSGGTIAFLTGIYERLVKAISSIDTTAVRLLFTGKFRQLFRHIDGWFLVSVLVGVVISTLSLAKLMTFLMESYPVQTWAFFFGLIVASSIFILKDIHGWKPRDVAMLLIGVIVGAGICLITPGRTPDKLWFIFIAGAIAICAMILPGISGSFLLLLLGKYEFIMATLGAIVSGEADGYDFAVIAVFLVGALIGILAFAKLLNKLLEKWFRPTLVFLAGFIIGSLVKVWPWSNIPHGSDPHIVGGILFIFVGIVLVFVLEWASARARRRTAVTRAGDGKDTEMGVKLDSESSENVDSQKDRS